MPKLRDYQVEAVRAVQTDWDAGYLNTLIAHATGLGKTCTATGLLKEEMTKNPEARAIFVAHRDELLLQPLSRFAEWWPESQLFSGVVKARQNDVSARLIFASIQTVSRANRLEQLVSSGPIDYLVYDECHHSVTKTAQAFIGALREANPNLKHVGMSATPWRSDGVGMIKAYDHIASQRGILWGVEHGWLVPPRGQQIATDVSLADVKLVAGDFAKGQLQEVLSAAGWHHLVARAYIEHGEGRQALAYTPGVQTSKELCEELLRLGVSAAHIDGTTPKEERRAIVKAFRERKIKVLSNCLDAETEVLTRRGWLRHDEMRTEDRVAAWDSKTGGIQWESISRIVRRPKAPGERMVSIKNQRLNIRVTEGHRMVMGIRNQARDYVKWRIVEAGELAQRNSPYCLPLSGHEEPFGTAVAHLTLDECKFIGLWMADGNLNRERGVTITQSDVYPKANAEIQRILTACEFDWRHHTQVYSSLGSGILHVYGVPWGSIGGQLRRRGFSRLAQYLDKDMNLGLLDLDREQAQAFIEGLWLGDGNKSEWKTRKNPAWRINSTNKVMLSRLQELCTLRGFAASLCGPYDNGPLATKPMYVLGIRNRQHIQTCNVHAGARNPAQYETGELGEIVWCVTNQTGTIITRRGGRVAIMGQCMIVVEGFDAPSTECILMARPTKSHGLLTQIVGRGLRPYPGKEDCLVLLFATTDAHILTLFDLGKSKKLMKAQKKAEQLGVEGFSEPIPLFDREKLDGAGLYANAISLFSESCGAWFRDGAVFSLGLGKDDRGTERVLIILPPDETLGWQLIGMGKREGKKEKWQAYDIYEHTEIDPVMTMANEVAKRRGAAILYDKAKRWRKQKASAKQVQLLTRLGKGLIAKSLSRGDAARLITHVLSMKTLRRLGYSLP